MRLALTCLLVLLAASLATAETAPPPAAFTDPALTARYEALTRELRCLVCQNQSIADSHAPLASDLRREVHAMLSAGASDREIVAFMTARYGDFVLYRPPVDRQTALLWFGPLLLLVLGAGVLVLVVRGRAQRGPEPEEGA